MLNDVQVVLCLDNSGSMKSNGYLAAAINDSSTFANIMLPDDAIGVVSFNNQASAVYDDGATPPQVKVLDWDNVVLKQVLDALSGLRARGRTNMQDGLNLSNNLLNPSDSKRNPAILLLSDGYANEGTLPPQLPTNCAKVYSIALGPSSDTGTLKRLAQESGGNYHMAPDQFELASLYFDIAEETNTVSKVIANEIMHFNTQANALKASVVDGVQTQRCGGLVPAGGKQITLAINWLEDMTYVTGTPTQSNQFSVKVYRNGQPVTLPQARQQNQKYLTFSVATDEPGSYIAEVSYLGSSAFQPTVAFLDYDRAAISNTLEVDVERHAKVGQPVNLTAALRSASGQPIASSRICGSVTSPTISAADAFKTSNKEIQEVLAADGNLVEQSHHSNTSPSWPLSRTKHEFAAAPKTGASSHECSYQFTPKVPGTYVVRLQAEERNGHQDTHTSHAKVVTLEVK